MKRLILIALLVVNVNAADAKFLRAVHSVETTNRQGAILGDNGRALGPFQIHYEYWLDSEVAGKYEDCVRYDYAANVVKAYLKKYAPKAYARQEYDTLARLHNAGPRALKNKKIALDYSRKVRQYLRD